MKTRKFSVVETNYSHAGANIQKSAILQDGFKLVVDYKPNDTALKPGTQSLNLYRYKTDVYEREDWMNRKSKLAAAMLRRLEKWQEKRDVLQPEHLLNAETSEHELEALRELGYLDDAESGAGHGDVSE